MGVRAWSEGCDCTVLGDILDGVLRDVLRDVLNDILGDVLRDVLRDVLDDILDDEAGEPPRPSGLSQWAGVVGSNLHTVISKRVGHI